MTHDFRYPLIMLAALATCSLLLRRTQARLPLLWWQKLGIGVGAFCGAMIGAKLPFALYDWDRFLDGSAWLSDGKTIMCGIIGGYFGVELAKWTLDIRVKTGDTFAVPCAVAVAIGRLACFVGGCCFGTPTSLPWGVVFPTSGDSLPRHPTQLYEAAFHLSIAGVLLALQQRGLFRGQLIKLYILIYLAYRFLTELIRPEARLELGLTIYQWAALAMMPLFVFLWWRDRNIAVSNLHLDAAISGFAPPKESDMSRPTPPGKPDPRHSVRPDSTGHLPPDRSDPYPDIPQDDQPGLVGGPTTESIPGTAHDDPLDPLARREKKIVVSLPKENDGGEGTLSGRPRETGGERP